MAAHADIHVHVAALVVALVKHGEWEAIESLYDWYTDHFGDSAELEHLCFEEG